MSVRCSPPQIIAFFTGISLILTACNLPRGGSAIPAIFGTPIPTATPTTTPTATPSPTPTPLPTVVIGAGESEVHNGDWDSAAAAFQQVQADPGATSEARGSAQFGLAEVALRRGDFAGAKTSFDQFLAEYQSHPHTVQAYFLRGDARMGLNDWAGAITDFQAYLSQRPGVIDSYVYERIGDSQLALGQTDAALKSYDQAIASERYFVGSLQLKEKVASIDRNLQQPDAAIAQYQAILQVAQNAGYKATIEFDIGQTLFEAGRYDDAYKQFDHVFMTYPNSFEAWSSLKALRDADQPVDQYQRGVVNFNQDKYDVAVEAFVNYWAANKPQLYRPESYLYLAKAYRQLGNKSAALTQLQVFLGRFKPTDAPWWGDGWLEMARTYADLNDAANAFSTYDKLVQDHPDLPQAADALFEAGQLAAAQGDPTKASGYFQRLGSAYPADPRAAAGLFDLGLTAYQSGDLANAEGFFQAASKLQANQRPAASQFWLGKTLVAAGRVDEAAQAFSSAVASDGEAGYYGLRAGDQAAGRAPFTAPQAFSFPANLDDGRVEAEQWLIQRLSLTESIPLANSLRSDIASDPRLVRAKELWDLGIVVDARQDFDSVRQSFQDDPLATYQLAIYFRDIGLYRSSVLAAGRLLKLAQVTPLQAPPFLARLRYPTYFSDLIIPAAARHELDPLLVFSLIWQESTFEGFATSTASAQGLMQIWPPTGDDIAKALSWPDYTPGDLQRPYVSVAFGTWLLQDELKRFKGDTYATLAAYNAGSGRVPAWQQASHGDPDLFLESVTLTEPKIYIERIYELYSVYSTLYGQK